MFKDIEEMHLDLMFIDWEGSLHANRFLAMHRLRNLMLMKKDSVELDDAVNVSWEPELSCKSCGNNMIMIEELKCNKCNAVLVWPQPKEGGDDA